MCKNKLKNFFNFFLSFFNQKIVNSLEHKEINLTKKNISPFGAYYLVGQQKVIINIRLSEGRTNRWFKTAKDSYDPAIFAVRNALNKNLSEKEVYEKILQILKEHKTLVRIKNAAELLNISNFNSKNIKYYPWWAEVKPWDNQTFNDKLKNYPIRVKRNRLENGMIINSDNPSIIMNENDKHSLPSHAKQYTKLIKQIKKNGYKSGETFGFVSVEFFSKNNKSIWKIGGQGSHRIAVVSALGIKRIPALVEKIIRFEDIDYWPNVKNGLFSKDQAKKIFLDIYNANPPRVQNTWINRIKKK